LGSILLFITILDTVGENMLVVNAEEHAEKEDCGLNTLQILEELENETKALNEEKMKLMETQEKLWFKIAEQVEDKRKINEKLKMEIEELKSKCDELAKIVNAFTTPR
jgi:hypothetical protein